VQAKTMAHRSDATPNRNAEIDFPDRAKGGKHFFRFSRVFCVAVTIPSLQSPIDIPDFNTQFVIVIAQTPPFRTELLITVPSGFAGKI